MSRPGLRVIERPQPASIPRDPLGFLAALGGPAAIAIPGRDRRRTRAVVTLLHGNEPSGIRAVHALLRQGTVPATDVLVVVAAVEAALAPPGFARRLGAGGEDLNRLFGSGGDGPGRALAGAILDLLDRARPEAVVDLHNNTGHSPAYGVVCGSGEAERQLVALFADRVVEYDLRLGALLEATVGRYPSAVVEAGRAGDAAADAVALRGLRRFLGEEVVLDPAARPALRVLRHPLRVEARPGVRLAFGAGPRPGADFTVAADVDRHNFERLPAGVVLGWLGRGSEWPLDARGADGADRSRELFAVRGGALVTRRPLVPIMMTTDPGIAASDCLFYTVQPEPQEGGE